MKYFHLVNYAQEGAVNLTGKSTGNDMDREALLTLLFGEAPGLVFEARRGDLEAALRIFDAEGVKVQEIGETRADSRLLVQV